MSVFFVKLCFITVCAEQDVRHPARGSAHIRSHKTSKMGNANITKVYLRSTYNEKESVGMGKQSIDRGFFGWLYDRLLDLADNKRRIFKENTELIVQMKETLPAWKVERISGALYGIVKEREMLLNEIYSWQEDEIKEKTELLFSGKLMSRTDDVSCLMNKKTLDFFCRNRARVSLNHLI